MAATPPHPALDPFEVLIPSLKSFWPALTSHFGSTASLLSLEAHKNYYAKADPMHTAIAICAFFSVYVWVMQQITGNASQVDGLWTFLPVIYTVHFTFQKAIAHYIDPPKMGLFRKTPTVWEEIQPRLALIMFLQVCWSTRLTYNAIRRGMFKKGEEDYRWPILRAGMNRFQWELFTITFIGPIQNILLALTALPSYIILTASYPQFRNAAIPRPPTHLVTGDYVISALLLTNLVVQFIADHQQQVYQNFKRGKNLDGTPLAGLAGTAPDSSAVSTTTEKTVAEDGSVVVVKGISANGHTPSDAIRGFVARGMWAYSRHPNFCCEQLTWWILYLFVPLTFVPDTPALSTWRYAATYALASPLIMNILFLASTLFSESVSAKKFPAYASYQKRVGMFLPFPDTFVRALYYKFLASPEVREQVEADVWGAPTSGLVKAGKAE